jgi:hypothetical protein
MMVCCITNITVAQTVNIVKLWATEIDNPTLGRDWSLTLMEDRDQKLISGGYTAEVPNQGYSTVIPCLHKLGKDGNVIWNTWDATIKMCPTNDNYGQVNAVIQKKNSDGTFGNYIVITKEKPCGIGSGGDRVGIYEINKNDNVGSGGGSVVGTPNTNVMGAMGWSAAAGTDILQKPDLSGYIITGYLGTGTSSDLHKIFVAEIDNNFNLVPGRVRIIHINTNRHERPVKLEYVFTMGRGHKVSDTGVYGIAMGNGGNYFGTHIGYALAANSYSAEINAPIYGNTSEILFIRLDTNLNHNNQPTNAYYIRFDKAQAQTNYGYTKQYNTSTSCTPTGGTNRSVVDYLILLGEQECFYTGSYGSPNYGSQIRFALACLFNETKTPCNGEYRDGDAVLVYIDEVISCPTIPGGPGPYNCPQYGGNPPCTTGIKYVRNVAHFSGGDFKFIAKPDIVEGNNVICSGSNRDNGIVPSGAATHFYVVSYNTFNNTRLWEHAFQGNQATGGCGFGMDIGNDRRIVVSGNNTTNNHDATFVKIGRPCGTGFSVYADYLTTNTTWNTSRIVDGIVTVTNGATLTIPGGVTISFANSCSGLETDNGSITVFGTLTRLAGGGNYLWKGIRAKGSGSIQFGSGALVEHAQTVVDAYATTGSPAQSPTIIGFAATFKNNQKGIKKAIQSVANANQTDIFQNCSFITDANVSSLVVSPVRIFEYTNADRLTVTSNSSFSDNTALDVQAFNKQGGRQLIVSHCTFTGIDKGIYLQGSSAADRILNNTFNNIPAAGMPIIGGYNPGNNYAVWLINTSAARMQDNTIAGTSRSSTAKIYGIIADNTGTGGDLMFRNTISNTFIGFQSQNNNSNYIVSCNNFNDYSYNLFFGPAWNTASGSMRQQGNSCANNQQQAGNEWTASCNTSDIHDVSVATGINFTYYAHSSGLVGRTNPQCSTPAWESNIILCISQPKTSSSCNTPFYTCPGCRLQENEYGINPALFQAKNYYRDLADGFKSQLATDSYNVEIIENAALYEGYVQLVSNEIIALLFENKSIDTAIWYLESSDLFEDKKLLAELYISIAEYSEAKKVLRQINNVSELTLPVFIYDKDHDNYSEENNAFLQLMNMVLNVYETGRDMKQLTDSELEQLETLSASGLALAGKACAYRKQATGKECQFEILPYIPEQDLEAQKKLGLPEDSNILVFNLYPNPAKAQLNILVVLPENETATHIEIHDIAGRKVNHILLNDETGEIQINTAALGNGLYICSLKNNNRTIKAVRFSILN